MYYCIQKVISKLVYDYKCKDGEKCLSSLGENVKEKDVIFKKERERKLNECCCMLNLI